MTRDRANGAKVVVACALALGLLGGFLWAQQIRAAQADERQDLDLFLQASSAGWAQVTHQFFQAPESAAESVAGLMSEMVTVDQQILLLSEMIETSDDIGAAFVGRQDGSFCFVARSDEIEDGGYRTRTISFPDGERRVDLAWTDSELQVGRVEADVADDYDPRLRPWFEPIAAGRDGHWTEPYVFASSQEPGITFSSGMYSPDGTLDAVIGIDISLAKLGAFLEELSPRDNGQALVVDSSGRVIAESSALYGNGDGVWDGPYESPELIDVLGQLSNSSTDASVSDTGVIRSPDMQQTTVVRTTGADDEWYLAVRALDSDFIEDETANNIFETGAVAVGVAALSGLIGLLLLRYLVGLKNEAEVDELTGVLSRRAVKRELHSTLHRAKGPVEVAILDLDNFKDINDTYGHPAGDEVLIVMGDRLHRFASTQNAVVGRLGGDEFIVFGEGQPAWAQLVLDLRDPIEFEDQTHRLSASIGVSTSLPDDQDDIDELMRVADRALFEVKRRGGSAVLNGMSTN